MAMRPSGSNATAWASCRCPADALWGAQTQRAVENFPISGRPMPRAFIRALALIKAGGRARQRGAGPARRRGGRGHRRGRAGSGRRQARRAVPGRRVPDRLRHQHQHECQRGHRAAWHRARLGRAGAPNDRRQHGPEQQRRDSRRRSTSARRCCGASRCCRRWQHLAATLRDEGSARSAHVVKTGRTHLMDAMPVTLRPGARRPGARRSRRASSASRAVEPRLLQLAQGGTAVGTGINAHPEFSARFCAELSQRHGHRRSGPTPACSRHWPRRTRPWNSPAS